MTVGFLLWSMSRYNGQSFGICGKTIASLRRNVITHIPEWVEGVFTVVDRPSENKLIISSGNATNTYYMFGGKDESSYTLVQGVTLAGVLFDEVALMPQSFVDQAMARCSVAGSKFWFNCNPENPGHWFYVEWIKKAQQHNILYLHILYCIINVEYLYLFLLLLISGNDLLKKLMILDSNLISYLAQYVHEIFYH